jgi:ElaB/YqjD/DUF883 family membrane-anchored ribosome-binding protein
MSDPHEESNDELRHQISVTKAQLSKKIEALGNQASESVDVASEAMGRTVETVKQTAAKAQHSVEKVGERLDVPLQIQRHPWVAMGAAVAVGYLGYRLFSGLSSSRELAYERESRRPERLPEPEPPQSYKSRPSRSRRNAESSNEQRNGHSKSEPKKSAENGNHHSDSWTSELMTGLRGMAVGALMSTVGDIASRTVPESLKGRVTSDVEGLKRNLGEDKPPTSSI